MTRKPHPGPVLIIGASGMLGRAWRELLTRRGITFHAPARIALELGKTDLHHAATTDLIRSHPVVINCAAWTDVDRAETEEAAATRINGDAVRDLAAACRAAGVLLVHYGTDYVFAGHGHNGGPYPVDAPTDPLNAYGRSKLVGERAIVDSIAAGGRALHIRTSWLYAPWGKNFVRTIAKAAREKPSLKVVNDQRGRPTSAEHLAAASLALIEKSAPPGVYHVTDGGDCTWFDFALEIAGRVNPQCRVDPCTTAEFPRPARRPAYSVLDLSKTESVLGPMPDWKDNLADVMNRLEM